MKKFKICYLSICISLSINAFTHASTVRNDIAYQIYRDFAENRGSFQAGAVNIPIYDNNGKLIGTLDKAPMPDFSSVSNVSGVATLIDPQHVVSVKHNGGYQNVSFGGSGRNPDYHRTSYQLVNRNNSPSRDFHVPRLNKLVTEVVPAVMTDAFNPGTYFDSSRFPIFYRIGSGTQYTQDASGKKYWQQGAYSYLTGGTVGKPVISDWSFVSATQDVFNDKNGPLGTYGEAGDSGSPLFAWDTLRKTWVLVGVLDSAIPGGNRWTILQSEFIKQILNKDNVDPSVILQNENQILNWNFNKITGAGTLSSGGNNWTMHGIKDGDLDAGKNLSFYGKNGQLLLDDNIDQGAGALMFGTDYIVSSETGKTWKGAGLIINPDVTVNWRVNGVSGDKLHKIGTGTLLVQGTGVNSGGLNVGDGTVILDQKADSSGKKQVFSTIDIVSGRPTVVLMDSEQIDPNNIYFGYRGGRLDLNGNNISLSRIKAVDNGAQIVNHNLDKAATLTLTGNGIGNTNLNQAFLGFFGETDTNKNNGELNIHYTPPSDNAYLALTGGANVNGTLFVDNGNVLLSGAPVLHANNIYLDDWAHSAFIFSNVEVAAGKGLQIGQYTTVLANINAGAGSHVVIGYNTGNEDWENVQKCMVNDNTGVVNCILPKLSDSDRDNIPYSSLTGDINLANNSILNVGKAIYMGSINGSDSSVMNMATDSRWIMPSDSSIGSLRMLDGAYIDLSGAAISDHDNILTIQGNLEGSGNFNLHTQVADKSGDRIIVNGLATGSYLLTVKDDGRDPVQDGNMMTLMSLNNQQQDFSRVDVSLTNGYADVGTYRYRLTRNSSDYVLYNPLIPWQPLEPSIPMPGNDQANWVSHNANTAISEFTSHFNLLSQQGENTERHLSNLKPNQTGLWMSWRENELHYSNSSYRPYRQKLTSQSLGYDWQVDTFSGNLQVGGVLINTFSNSTFDEGASSRNSASGVNIYSKFNFNSGMWITGFAGAHYLDYSLNDQRSAERSGMYGYIAGLGAGYTWTGETGLTVQPEVGIALYGLPSWRYQLNENMDVNERATNPFQYRAGLKINKDIMVNNLNISPFIQLMQRVNSQPTKSIQVNQHKLDAALYSNRTELNIGNDFNFTKDFQVSVQGGYTIGGGLDASKELSATLKYNF